MRTHGNHRTSVSALIGSPVADAAGGTFGYVREVAVGPSFDAAHIQGIVIKPVSAKRGDRPSLVPITELQLTPSGLLQLRDSSNPMPLPDDDGYLLLERDLVDQQIIDVHGHK